MREEIPAIIFVSIVLIVSTVAFFQIFSKYEERVENVYFHKQALSILERKINEFQEDGILKQEINQTIWNKGFIAFVKQDIEKETLLKISLPVLIKNSTNPGKVSIYAWK